MITASRTPAAAPAGVSETTSPWQHALAAMFIVALSSSFFLTQYDRARLAEPALEAWYRMKAAGTLSIGDQYRVAVPFAAHFLEVHTGLQLRQTVPLLEAIGYAVGLAALYLLLVGSPVFATARRVERVGLCGLFFAAVQLPVLWIFPWERPETLPTMGYLAVIAVILVSRRIPFALACVLALGASAVQAFARTDAPMVVGLATVLAALIGGSLPRTRKEMAALGVLCGVGGAAVQLYLKHRFPDRYPGQRATDFQLFHNLNPFYAPAHLPEFFTAMLPFLFSMAMLWKYWAALDGTDRVTLLIALVYLPIYLTFGILAEVRIYVPYLFLLAPLFAKVWMRLLKGDGAAQVEAQS